MRGLATEVRARRTGFVFKRSVSGQGRLLKPGGGGLSGRAKYERRDVTPAPRFGEEARAIAKRCRVAMVAKGSRMAAMIP